jgi:hypothetical protein
MTRPGSRDHGRRTTTDRPAVSYATGTPDLDAPMRHCACGAAYRDHDTGHAAHRTVFGHRPIRKTAPAPAESAPENSQEGGEIL